MRPVAKRFIIGLLAQAKPELFRFLGHDLHRLDRSQLLHVQHLVLAVAKGLRTGKATRAPHVDFAFLKRDLLRQHIGRLALFGLIFCRIDFWLSLVDGARRLGLMHFQSAHVVARIDEMSR